MGIIFCGGLVGATPVWTPYTVGVVKKSALALPLDRCAVCELDSDALSAVIGQGEMFEVSLPMPDGLLRSFTVSPANLMHPDLAAKFPGIRVFEGTGVDGSSVRIDVSPKGLRAQILGDQETIYIDPYYDSDASVHASYHRKDLGRDTPWQCHVPVQDARVQLRQKAVGFSNGETLRTYRIAIAATGEYTQFHGGTVAGGMAGIVTTLNRVVGIYQRELAVSFQLVADNELLVFTDAATDGYSNSNASALLIENQAKIDAVIGDADYDIGHVFSTDGGGLALEGICVTGDKAMGETGDATPSGTAFDVDFVAHEIGHQLGGEHTFNGTASSCSGNRAQGSAYEPGSGSTIMGYAGICSVDNLQGQTDGYFHSVSLEEILNFIGSGGGTGCGVQTATGNNPPVVDAGSNFVIPASTPFVLTATGSDPDGDNLQYTWEERDLGPAQPLTASDNGLSPLLRSWEPVADPSRTVPRLPDLLANGFVAGEKLPSVSRSMNFRVTARDGRSTGGGIACDDMVVTVEGGAGPFLVTEPNTPVFWSGEETVRWDPAGSAVAPVNAATVNILLSLDGGFTYPIVLAADALNDGAQLVTLPNIRASDARIKIEAVGNIFFDVSNSSFSINPSDALQLTPAMDRQVTGLSGLLSTLPCFTYVATNTGGGALTFSASTDVPWLSVMPATQSLAGGTAADVDICFSAAADSLLPGDYSGQLFVVNDGTMVTNRWSVSLTVDPSGGLLAFDEGASAAHEDDGSFFVSVVRSGATNMPATVDVSVVDGTAVVDVDFTVSPTNLSWGAGEGGVKLVTVSLIDDALPELAETASLVLANAGMHAVISVPSNHVFTVLDDDETTANDVCSNAVNIAQLPFTNSQLTSVLTSAGDPVPGCGINGANGGWYRLVVPTTGTLVIDTSGSNFNTVLAAYVGTCGALTPIGCDNDSGIGSTARLELPAFVGETLYILAGGFNGSSGTLEIGMSMVPATNPCFSQLSDGDFEGGGANADWTVQTSTQYVTVICDASCNPTAAIAAPFSGATWAWFGTNNGNLENASVGQTVYIPSGTATLRFQLWIATADGPRSDQFDVKIDNQVVASFPEPAVADSGYVLRSFDISNFADGGFHDLLFEYTAPGEGHSDYNVDNVEIEVCYDDLDGDGIPNDWENTNGLNAGDPSDAGLDGDGDGMSGLEEYIANTDPINGDDFLQLLLSTTATIDLSFNSASNRNYRIDASPAINPLSWSPVQSEVIGHGGVISVTDTNAAVSNLFYRLNVELP